VANSRIGDLIRDQKVEEVPDAIAEGEFFDMQTFTDALIELVLSGEIDRDVAANAATNRHDFLVALDHALKRQKAGIDHDQPLSEIATEEPEPEPEPPGDELPGLRLAGSQEG
jgi:Tfp pilus assembly ATPase PilU